MMSTKNNNSSNKSSIFSSKSSIDNNEGIVNKSSSSSSPSPHHDMLDKHISKTFSESFDDEDEEDHRQNTHQLSSIDSNGNNLPNVQLLVEKNHVQRTGTPFFFETVIQRDPKTKNKFILSLQTTYNGTFPIFCAEKASSLSSSSSSGSGSGSGSAQQQDGTVSYNLRSMVKKNNQRDNDPGPYSNIILGTVMKQQEKKNNNKKNNNTNKDSSTSTVTYEVIHHDRTGQDPSSTTSKNTLMALIEYEYINKVQHFIKGGRPRYAQIELIGRDDVESKEPNQEASGQRVLDFNGRGGKAISTKNMQIVNNNTDGKVVLQIVKWNDNEFNLDFSYPFDAFHAFAFALAQFDFKSH
jgi:hypothetical protein